MNNYWVVYVGERAKQNFNIGFDNGVWGHKVIFKNVKTKDIKEGDVIYFIQHLQKLKGALGNNAKNGFPRVPIEELFGVIKSISKCEVTSNYYESNNTVWSDDIYPHRYNFKVLTQDYNANFGLEFFERTFVSAVRESLLTKGSPIKLELPNEGVVFVQSDSFDMEVEEGNIIYRTHRLRERNSEIVNHKKSTALELKGFLSCEVCGFNFTKTYGVRGKNYIECHHKNPLSDTKVGSKTKAEDLALLCANCHRVIHRYKPWISVEELRENFKDQL